MVTDSDSSFKLSCQLQRLITIKKHKMTVGNGLINLFLVNKTNQLKTRIKKKTQLHVPRVKLGSQGLEVVTLLLFSPTL